MDTMRSRTLGSCGLMAFLLVAVATGAMAAEPGPDAASAIPSINLDEVSPLLLDRIAGPIQSSVH